MPNPNKFNLRAKPIQAIQVNKRVVIIVSAILALTILLSVIYAFSWTSLPKPQARKSEAIKAEVVDKPVISELKDMPNNYSDVKAINKYMNSGSSIEFDNLKQQLDSLKNSYMSLEQQLSDKDREKPRTSPEDEKAKESPVVFAGLGGTTENLAGPDTPFGKGTSKDKDKGDEVASKKQEEFYEQQGDNKRKLAVMKSQVDNDKADLFYDMHSMVKPFSRYQVNAGTLIPATLITGIDTTIAGTIVAQVRQDIYDNVTGKYLLIPKGSKLLGEYDSRHVAYGQRRIAMWYTRIIRPDGSSIALGKPAGVDSLGQSGVEGNVDNHWAQIIGAATISTLLSVGAAVAANRNVNATNNQVTTGQQAGQGVSQAVSGIGSQLTSRAMGVATTITLPPGYQFFITTKKDMVLTPYKKRR